LFGLAFSAKGILDASICDTPLLRPRPATLLWRVKSLRVSFHKTNKKHGLIPGFAFGYPAPSRDYAEVNAEASRFIKKIVLLRYEEISYAGSTRACFGGIFTTKHAKNTKYF
jgi:hypothetical protein